MPKQGKTTQQQKYIVYVWILGKETFFQQVFKEREVQHCERRKVSDDLSRECNKKKNEHSLRCTAET